MDWDDEVDVLVAGSGAGLVGAYTAAREGLAVAVAEATDKFGGTTAYSGGGIWYPANPVLRRAGVEDTVEDALTYYHAVVGDRTPRDLQDAYLRRGPDRDSSASTVSSTRSTPTKLVPAPDTLLAP